jgi:hypothetical protein
LEVLGDKVEEANAALYQQNNLCLDNWERERPTNPTQTYESYKDRRF